MELHLINITRFILCIVTIVVTMIVMLKADDNNAMRRLSAMLGVVIIYFNMPIGQRVYLIIVAVLETLFAMAWIGFFIAVCIVIVLLPFLIVWKKLKH